jgi:hypothetical protein
MGAVKENAEPFIDANREVGPKANGKKVSTDDIQ